jgi:hypothetical protein
VVNAFFTARCAQERQDRKEDRQVMFFCPQGNNLSFLRVLRVLRGESFFLNPPFRYPKGAFKVDFSPVFKPKNL